MLSISGNSFKTVGTHVYTRGKHEKHLSFLGGPARGAEGTRIQADMFPWTSSARNPIVIVKIFIFLPLKVVLQAKPFKGETVQFGGLVQTPARTSDTKNYIYPPPGGALT